MRRLLLIATLCLLSAPAWAVLAIDGHGSGSGAGTSCQSATTGSFTTTNATDVLILDVIMTWTTNSFTESVTSSPSLTWTNRIRQTDTSNSRTFEEWYATTTATGSYTVTVGCSTGSSNVGNVNAVVFAISGANTASPFDGSAVGANGTNGTPAVSITTANANDMVIGGLTAQDSPTVTAGTSFTKIITSGNPTGPYVNAEDRVVSSTQSGLSVAWTQTGASFWEVTADAVKAASATCLRTLIDVGC